VDESAAILRSALRAMGEPGSGEIIERFIMVIHCIVSLRVGATPAELTALGIALWRWCLDVSAGSHGRYPCLGNQTLADLVARQVSGGPIYFRGSRPTRDALQRSGLPVRGSGHDDCQPASRSPR
jgi:hypothetical protein